MHHSFFLSLLLVLVVLLPTSSMAQSLRPLHQFPFHKPAFITAHPSPIHTNITDLLLSSFGIQLRGSPDRVEFIPDIARALRESRRGGGEMKTYRVGGEGDALIWPNEVNLVDASHLVVPGGFLVPGKRGHISVLDYVAFRRKGRHGTAENRENVREGNGNEEAGMHWKKIIDVKEGFFHRVEKVNVLNKAAHAPDTGERMVTCRGWKTLLGKSGGELVYLEPNRHTGEFTLKKMADGCDCFFIPVDFNGDGVMEFVVPEFFGQKLSLVWTEDPLGDYSNEKLVRQRVIDGNLGAAFDVQAVDLDNDGMMEVVVTNHQNGKKGVPPSLFAYHVVKPAIQPQAEQWVLTDRDINASPITEFMTNLKFHRYTLSSNFSVINRAFMSAAPGGAQAVWIHQDPTHPQYDPYPALIVSGDGSEKAYLLTRRHRPLHSQTRPEDDGSDKKWEYDQIEFHDCKGTVGGIYAGDVDGDGWTDVFVPCYDKNYVAVYTFAP